jgi:hypothetical protein
LRNRRKDWSIRHVNIPTVDVGKTAHFLEKIIGIPRGSGKRCREPFSWRCPLAGDGAKDEAGEFLGGAARRSGDGEVSEGAVGGMALVVIYSAE